MLPSAIPNSSADIFSFISTFARSLIDFLPALGQIVKDIFGFLVGISLVLSLFFFIGIIYCVQGLKLIRQRESEIYDTKVEPAFEAVGTGDAVLANRWESAKKHIESDNPNDWKQAIMEADIILDELLTRLGYQGATIGDKLKRVNAGDMKTLNDAWEAHKIRNQVAHEGSAFSLSHHDAKEVWHRYKRVFEEFYYI